MLYDLNELVNETEDVDYFTINGIPYQIGDISEKYRKAILAIDPKCNIIEAWRPVIA